MSESNIRAIIECLPHQEARLTRRQADVVWRIVCGLKDGAIAFELKITVSAVRVHIRAAMDATGTSSRGALGLWWVARNLIEVSGFGDEKPCDTQGTNE